MEEEELVQQGLEIKHSNLWMMEELECVQRTKDSTAS
jgi:hypothetical protein